MLNIYKESKLLKEARQAAGTGTALVTQTAFIVSPSMWLPSFNFLGTGMILGGVMFLLPTSWALGAPAVEGSNKPLEYRSL